MVLHRSLSVSFDWQLVFHCVDVAQFVYLLTGRRAFGLFLDFGDYK